jgi:hypothetical protein
MNDFFNFNASTITGIIAGFLATMFFYLIGRKRKKPYYIISSFNLVNSELKQLDGIEICYKGSRVEDLTATQFIFWNDGKDTIDKNDVPEAAPLNIKAKDASINIYAAEVVSMTDASNKVEVNLINKLLPTEVDEVRMTYDYLDKGQKNTIKILHSGKPYDLIVNGKIKGVGNFKDYNSLNYLYDLYTFIIGVVFIVLFSLFSSLYLKNNNLDELKYMIPLGISAGTIASLIYIINRKIRNKPIKLLYP